jgi:hypothetical protein
MVGFPNRNRCPVYPDGHPERLEKERELIGGDFPVWELQRKSGNIRIANPGEWMAVISGIGRGRIRWKYPNGKATSPWLEVNKR